VFFHHGPANTYRARFTNAGPDVVFDSRTGNLWRKADNGQDIGFLASQQYCQQFGGAWVLPTWSDLEAIYFAGDGVGAQCGLEECKVSEIFSLSGYLFWSGQDVGPPRGLVMRLVNLVDGDEKTSGSGSATPHSRALCVKRP